MLGDVPQRWKMQAVFNLLISGYYLLMTSSSIIIRTRNWKHHSLRALRLTLNQAHVLEWPSRCNGTCITRHRPGTLPKSSVVPLVWLTVWDWDFACARPGDACHSVSHLQVSRLSYVCASLQRLRCDHVKSRYAVLKCTHTQMKLLQLSHSSITCGQ